MVNAALATNHADGYNATRLALMAAHRQILGAKEDVKSNGYKFRTLLELEAAVTCFIALCITDAAQVELAVTAAIEHHRNRIDTHIVARTSTKKRTDAEEWRLSVIHASANLLPAAEADYEECATRVGSLAKRLELARLQSNVSFLFRPSDEEEEWDPAYWLVRPWNLPFALYSGIRRCVDSDFNEEVKEMRAANVAFIESKRQMEFSAERRQVALGRCRQSPGDFYRISSEFDYAKIVAINERRQAFDAHLQLLRPAPLPAPAPVAV